MNVFRVSAKQSLGIHSAWLILQRTLNDVTQPDPATRGFGLLSPRSTLSSVTLIIGDPQGDLQ